MIGFGELGWDGFFVLGVDLFFIFIFLEKMGLIREIGRASCRERVLVVV